MKTCKLALVALSVVLIALPASASTKKYTASGGNSISQKMSGFFGGVAKSMKSAGSKIAKSSKGGKHKH